MSKQRQPPRFRHVVRHLGSGRETKSEGAEPQTGRRRPLFLKNSVGDTLFDVDLIALRFVEAKLCSQSRRVTVEAVSEATFALLVLPEAKVSTLRELRARESWRGKKKGPAPSMTNELH